jgi:hypothetical protein
VSLNGEDMARYFQRIENFKPSTTDPVAVNANILYAEGTAQVSDW